MAKTTKIALASYPLSRFLLALIQHFSHGAPIAIHRARTEEASKESEAFLALAPSIAHEIDQPLTGTITNVNTFLGMPVTDLPSIDGTRETARRPLKDAFEGCGKIVRGVLHDQEQRHGHRLVFQPHHARASSQPSLGGAERRLRGSVLIHSPRPANKPTEGRLNPRRDK
jgi:hypothetical protein